MANNNRDNSNEYVIRLFWFGVRVISTAFILGVVYISVWGIEYLVLIVLEKTLNDLLSQSTQFKSFFNLIKLGSGFLIGILYLIHNIFGFIALIKVELEAFKDD